MQQKTQVLSQLVDNEIQTIIIQIRNESIDNFCSTRERVSKTKKGKKK